MTIQDVINKRDIKFLVHFTRLENLANILTNGILPRNDLKDKLIHPFEFLWGDGDKSGKYIYNDDYRYDGKCDYSCFSVHFPNSKMFFSLREKNKHSKWAVICFSSDILLKYECLFYPCNAADGSVRNKDIKLFQGADALENMFFPEGRDDFLSDCDPTDVQAEVMIKGNISPTYIISVIINHEQETNKYRNLFPEFNFYFIPNGSKCFTTRKAFIFGH